jgi:glutamine amidotransferase
LRISINKPIQYILVNRILNEAIGDIITKKVLYRKMNSKLLNSQPKKLAIILEGYPFSMGEPFFHEELQQLSEHFDDILLVTRLSGPSPIFQIPDGVRVLCLSSNTSTLSTKIRTLTKRLLASFFRETRRDLKNQGVPLNTLTFKTALAYLESAERMSRELTGLLEAQGEVPNDYLWYSYWCNSEAYMLSLWKEASVIERFYVRAHGADLYAERHPFSYLPFRENILKQATGFCCISEHGKRYLWERFPRYSHGLSVHRLGVAVQEMIPWDGKTTKRILSLSGIVPVKNLETLITALAEWRGETLEWHHIGDGGDLTYVRTIHEMAESLLSVNAHVHFKFHGFLPLSEVLTRIQDLKPDVLINVSHFEGIPVSMMECASFGIPIIGPAVCGVPEVVQDGKNGILIKDFGPKQVLEAIDRFFSLGIDEVLAMRHASKKLQEKRFNARKNYRDFARFLCDNEPDDPMPDILTDVLPEVAILDLGLGNIAAVHNILNSLDIPSRIEKSPDALQHYRTVVLPGVGSFDHGMRRLHENGLSSALKDFAHAGGQVIGICLGMQLLFDTSEEGSEKGLGLIPGNVVRFQKSDFQSHALRIPHMGWNTCYAGPAADPSFRNQAWKFYFTHSYYAKPDDSNSILFWTDHGSRFASAVRYGNVWGFQFHPEKSHQFGKALLQQLLKNR